MTPSALESQKRPLVLVVDDDPHLLALYQEILGDECNYVVSSHPEHVPTIDEIRRIGPDVMVIDQWLGRATRGMELVAALRATEDLRTLPIVFCSSDSRQLEQLAPAIQAFSLSALIKPFTVDQLVDGVAAALEQGGIDPAPCP